MKKKVLYGVALAFCASVAMGTLQSCKDDIADLSHQVAYDKTQLEAQIRDLLGQIAACRQHCDAERAKLLQRIENNEGNIAQLRADLDALRQYVGTLVTLDQLQQDLLALKSGITSEMKSWTTEQINALALTINQRIDALNNALNDLENKFNVNINGLNDRLNKLNIQLDDLQNDVATNTILINGNRIQIDKNTKDIVRLGTELEDLDSTINAVDSILRSKIESNAEKIKNDSIRLDSIIKEVTILGGTVEDLADSLDNVAAGLKTLAGTVQAHTNAISNINKQLGDLVVQDSILSHKIDSIAEAHDLKFVNLENKLDNEINEVNKNLLQTQEMISQLYNLTMEEVANLQSQIDGINGKLNELYEFDKNLITGIILQGTDNPIFGNFSLPLGIKANMLFNWYAYNNHEGFDFPSAEKAYSFDAENPALSTADLGFIKPEYLAVPQGFMADEFTVGKVYMTVNPVGNNFDGTHFTLETSARKSLPLDVRVSKSDETLYFGYSRATENGGGNGFYEAEIVLNGNEINNPGVMATKIVIDDQLKTAVKDALKDRTKRNAYELLRAVYNQMAGLLPAYAMRYDWTVEYMNWMSEAEKNKYKDYAVLSDYNLAVATAKPLSYKFLYGKGLHKNLPTFGHISNLIYKLKEDGDLHFDFTNNTIKFDKFNIQLKPITITASVSKPDAALSVSLGRIDVISTEGPTKGQVIGYIEPAPFEVEGLDDEGGLYDQIQSNFKNAIDTLGKDIDGWTSGVADQINGEVNKMLDQIKTEIDRMMSNISGQINDKIDHIIDKYGNKAQPWFNRLNRVVDMYNRVANKINDMTDNPNAYLQPLALYAIGSDFGRLSTKVSDPTPFVQAGGDSFTMFLTSYTGEIIAPAFKKFVAVTNVYEKTKENGKSIYKSVRDTKGNVKEINAQSDRLNNVLDGASYRVAIPTTKMTKGLIYEIVYQGLDHNGYTSTRKFYITVK